VKKHPSTVSLEREEAMNEYTLEYIKLQWADIHHSRQQDKLVAGGLLSRPGIKEVPWESAKWTCCLDNDLITKSVLLNQRDVFQWSLAHASSKQDWHYHNHAFEVYVSGDPMDLEYVEQDTERKTQALHVNRGLLIIPPGIPHKVSLSGNTFVFQATLAGRNLGEDKVLGRGS